ncbi:MAG: hypothetical protein HYR74_06395 [Candidatus Eisenbacteria bacterium]|nr:hypothetical protein [Candidatus Eisenbacteria bacterium]
MRPAARRLALSLLAAPLLLSSCAILSPPAPREGGDRLSDAAKETARKPADQQPVAAGERVGDGGGAIDLGVDLVASLVAHRRDPACPPAAAPDAPGSDLVPAAPRPWWSTAWHVGAVAGAGSIVNAEFAPFALYGLRAGLRPTPRTSVDLALMGGPSRFTGGSDIARLLRDPFELAADLSGRIALMPRGVIGIAPVVGLRGGTLFWRYRNGLEVMRDGELHHVDGDGIDDVSAYAGLALTLVPAEHFELTAVGATGWRFFDTHTNAGLSNDLFADTRFSEIRLESTVSF